MESITLVEPSTSEVVSASEVASHLRLNTDDESTLVSAWIAAAVSLFEQSTGYIVLDSEHRLSLDGWPGQIVRIARRPVSSIEAVEYLDTAEQWVELAGWSADLDAAPARVVLPDDLPNLADRLGPRVRVTFRAGHAVPAVVPPLIVTAIKLLASHYFSVRESHTVDTLRSTPAGWDAIVNLYRIDWLGGPNGCR